MRQWPTPQQIPRLGSESPAARATGAVRRACGIVLALAALLLRTPIGVTDAGGAAPIIDNERVTVWDVTWSKDAANVLARRNDDYVVVYLSNGRMKLTRPNGDSITTPATVGDVVFQPKGTVKTEENVSEEPVHARVIDLHDHYVAPLKNTSGYPNAFPRPGSKKLLENKRVVVWDYTFTAGTPSPMHFHDKDVVVTYMADGAVTSTTPDGQSETNEISVGLTKFNARSRTHTEQLVRGKSRVIAVELK
jgi:quercetin dioxygenase-like cupin family protein